MNKKNSSHNSRASLSISSPIAESTQLNKSYKFPWGGKFSPAQKYSAACNANNKINSKLMENAGIKSTKMYPVNVTKIDPRVYTDIHSKGLTSRIVKYHDDSLKLNRSLSIGGLYNKPGQFPIVHLNKSPIQYKANRNRPASMVRIAPPDNAVFQANTRSSILRTPSIVPTVNLRKTNSELSCENRPILHPADSGDLVPTRSVLDALREISRKRINSDDLDGNDVIKKYCKDSEDTSRGIASSNSLSNSFAMKRQREVQISPKSQMMNSNREQAIKKRMYTRNNDISSSLSSSLHIITPKRKLDDIQNNYSTSAILLEPSENSTSPRAKQQCNERHNQQQLRNKSSLNIVQPSTNQITASLPATTANEKSHPISSKNASSAVVVAVTTSNENTSQKPKLMLFNKNYDDEDFKKILDSRKILREREEYGGTSGIKFVKPRNASYIQLEKNPMIEKMKQSRLALMLKGLKGELNENSDNDDDNEDETDTLQKTKTISQQEISTKSDSINIGSVVTTSASMSFATNTTVSTSTISSPAIAVNPKTSQQDQKEISTIGNSSNSGFSFGLKTNTVVATSTVSNSILPSIGTTTTITTAIKPSGGFSFGPNTVKKSTSNTEANSTTIPVSTTHSTTTVSSNNSSAGGFTFGDMKSASDKNLSNANTTFLLPSKASTENTLNSAPQLSQDSFNFGNQQSAIAMTQSKPAFVHTSNMSSASTDKKDKTPTTTQSLVFGTPTISTAGFSNFSSNIQSTSGITKTLASTLPNQTPSMFAFSSSPKNLPSGSFSNNPLSNVATTSVSSIFAPNTQDKVTTSFNSPQTSGANTASIFGNLANSNFSNSFTEPSKTNNSLGNKPSGGFTFGNVKNASEENTPGPFAFGSTPPSSSVGGFSFKNPTPPKTTTTTLAGTTSSQFSFAGTGNQIGNQLQTSSSNVGFNFETPSRTTDVAKPFSFNISNQSQTTSSSTISTATPVFAFGGNVINSSENKQTAFANPTTTTSTATVGFSFNNANSQNTFSGLATNKNSIGGLSFNSPTSTENKFSGFGTFSVISTTQQTQPSQLSNSKFSFSSISNNKGEIKPLDSSSSSSSSIFPAGNNAQNSTFGGSSLGQAKSFNFASNTTNINSQNLFGASSVPTKSTSAFSFGGSSTTQQETSNTPFTFGAPSNNTNQMSNPFASNSTLNKTPTFNFTGQNNNTANFLGQGGSNTTIVNDRLIRKATRRLKNS